MAALLVLTDYKYLPLWIHPSENLKKTLNYSTGERHNSWEEKVFCKVSEG